MSLPPGAVLARRYRVIAQLGEGGMGSVYSVEDTRRPGTLLALKELLDDATATPEDIAQAHKRFDDEIALMRKLSHPRIPAFVESFSEGSRRYFVMELIPGSNLEERLERARAPLAEPELVRWMASICEVLTYLHGRRPPVIVRDLKPANIMVTPDGDVRLLDFGIARTYKPGKLSNTENLGTMTYASPEHLGHTQTDARSDIYSLGATMYHLLTNTEPKPMETPLPGSFRRLQPALSEAVERVIIRAMELDPTRRYQSAREMRDALLQCLPQPSSAIPIGKPAPVRRTRAAAPATLQVPAVAVAPIPVASSTRARPAPAAGSTGAPVHQGRFCPECGYLNRAKAKFCIRDGTPLDGSARPAQRRMPVPETAPFSGALAAGTTAALNAQRAQESFAAARYAQAVRQSELAIAAGRGTYELHLLRGQSYRKLGRPVEAAQALAQASRLRPTAEALAELGRAERDAGRLIEAQIAFTKARQLAPRDVDVCYELGRVCLSLEQNALAEGELREALALRPGDALTLAALSQALAAQNRATDAVTLLEHAVSSQPTSGTLQTALATCYHALGQNAQARQALHRALALDAHDDEARGLLARL